MHKHTVQILVDGSFSILNLFNRVSVLMSSMSALMQNGALELEGGELSFEAGSDGRPKKVEGKTPLPMMAVVAEMMIFANAAVAHRIAGAFPGAALLRRHAPPRPEGFEQVAIIPLLLLQSMLLFFFLFWVSSLAVLLFLLCLVCISHVRMVKVLD